MYKHCCKYMRSEIDSNSTLLKYNPEDRSYSFILHDDPGGTHAYMYYCPWCGKKIPDDLAAKWIEILETEYAIEDPSWNRDKVPKEFLTDEWWKKRGL